MTTKRNVYVWTMRCLMWLAVGVTGALTVFIVGYVLVRGVPHLSWEFLSTKPSYLSGNIGILPDVNNQYLGLPKLVIWDFFICDNYNKPLYLGKG